MNSSQIKIFTLFAVGIMSVGMMPVGMMPMGMAARMCTMMCMCALIAYADGLRGRKLRRCLI